MQSRHEMHTDCSKWPGEGEVNQTTKITKQTESQTGRQTVGRTMEYRLISETKRRPTILSTTTTIRNFCYCIITFVVTLTTGWPTPCRTTTPAPLPPTEIPSFQMTISDYEHLMFVCSSIHLVIFSFTCRRYHTDTNTHTHSQINKKRADCSSSWMDFKVQRFPTNCCGISKYIKTINRFILGSMEKGGIMRGEMKKKKSSLMFQGPEQSWIF